MAFMLREHDFTHDARKDLAQCAVVHSSTLRTVPLTGFLNTAQCRSPDLVYIQWYGVTQSQADSLHRRTGKCGRHGRSIPRWLRARSRSIFPLRGL